MNNERLIIKGLIMEKEEKLRELDIKADRYIKDINVYTFHYITDGIKGIEIDHARQAMKELEQAIDAYRLTEKEIERLQKEL